MNHKAKKTRIFAFITILTFIISIILLVPNLAFAQENDEAEEEEEEIIIPEEITFDITYPELRAKEGETFEFKADLSYFGKEEEVTIDITVDFPEGWYAGVTPAYEAREISAVILSPLKKESLKVIAIPLVKMEPGEYDIIVKASIEDLGVEEEVKFKAIITATYKLELATKTGRLSTDVTSGKDNHFALNLKNSGSASIENITLSSIEPEGWLIDFDPKEIETLEAGKTKEIDLTITPPEKTIAGDYMLTISANSENSQHSIDIRVTVLTPTIWGWLGIGIIVVVIIGVAIIFARLGRR